MRLSPVTLKYMGFKAEAEEQKKLKLGDEEWARYEESGTRENFLQDIEKYLKKYLWSRGSSHEKGVRLQLAIAVTRLWQGTVDSLEHFQKGKWFINNKPGVDFIVSPDKMSKTQNDLKILVTMKKMVGQSMTDRVLSQLLDAKEFKVLLAKL